MFHCSCCSFVTFSGREGQHCDCCEVGVLVSFSFLLADRGGLYVG